MSAPEQLEYLLAGRITAAHGLDGEVRVQSLTTDPNRFNELKDCFLVSADEKQRQAVSIESVRLTPDRILIKLAHIDDRTAAERLRGCFIAVNRRQAVALPPDSWFICDLIGCGVYDMKRGYLGVLSDVLQPSAQDIYVVRLDGVPDLLFPALKSILIRVDIAEKRIDINLPEGLYEVYREEMA
ncbi:MAG: ribosome maturation factor RimM [Clostridiaceae bacterium]|nr:ribosome maturation factor RimM [Clostridiaceae bacterium]